MVYVDRFLLISLPLHTANW